MGNRVFVVSTRVETPAAIAFAQKGNPEIGSRHCDQRIVLAAAADVLERSEGQSGNWRRQPGKGKTHGDQRHDLKNRVELREAQREMARFNQRA